MTDLGNGQFYDPQNGLVEGTAATGTTNNVDPSTYQQNEQTPTAPNAPSASTTTTTTTDPTTTTAQSASGLINTWAQQNGLGALSDWINSQSSSLAGQGLSSSDIQTTIEQSINTAPGFDAALPGYNDHITATGNNGGGIGAYISYVNQLDQYAQTAGLAPGTISAADVGSLWAGSVSASEASTRLTTDYANAANAWNNIPGFQDAMKAQGMTSLSQLASWYINPTNTLNQINQQISAAQLGAESGNTGFGELSASQASALSAFLTNSGSSQLTTTDANHAFTQTSLGTQVQGSAAELAAGGFEGTRPGQSSTGTVTQDQLLGAIEGNAPDSAAVSQAQQARTASNKGGGGATTTANGAVGLGYAQS